MDTRDTSSIFLNCYIMQKDDIERFADTLADGFSRYNLFEYICNGYNREKMRLFWAVSMALVSENSICIADSKQINSVMVYVRPGSKEFGLMSYLRAGGLKMLLKMGINTAIKLLRFEDEAKRFANKYQGEKDGYLMAFATRIDKQRQGYSKYLAEALLHYLDASGEGCYLETLKAENVGYYEGLGFELKSSEKLKSGNLTLFAMHRPAVLTKGR